MLLELPESLVMRRRLVYGRQSTGHAPSDDYNACGEPLGLMKAHDSDNVSLFTRYLRLSHDRPQLPKKIYG